MAAVFSMTAMLGISVFASERSDSEENAWAEIDKYVSEQYSSLSSAEQEELAEEIYLEKYSVASESYTAEETSDEVFVDVAYENMLERENYIVELITLCSGMETTFEEWEYNLDYLKEHYDEIMSLEGINSAYVDRYIEDYEIVRATKDMPESQINGTRTRASSYAYISAINYAKDHAESGTYNPAYPDWTSYGGDCANFISQCLYAGGKSMKGTPGTSAASGNLSNWFSTGTSCNTSNVSATWRGASAFKSYWTNNLAITLFVLDMLVEKLN